MSGSSAPRSGKGSGSGSYMPKESFGEFKPNIKFLNKHQPDISRLNSNIATDHRTKESNKAPPTESSGSDLQGSAEGKKIEKSKCVTS